ncbi:hypothetical protein [Jannaschia aquimarina]|uniref:Uncharacterized protein n=1 Tax=Jannaschia aquimarina TaxID=935700 RepID=A0A0D1EKK0_9RHOB|nr:hypothetical protein [Jannaschia aquimarina]KIT17551.1 hypothetical protein jaqu_07400 [Jannaschia aquimarina]SNS73079.1 hypothetical protein SAMN05421775_10267 [Jannaschia aquimarina]
MQAVRALHTDPTGDSPPDLLVLLRRAALECRASARLDTARACALFDPESKADEIARLLARALPQAMHVRPRFHATEASARSFDERWILAIADAIARRDIDSERFLLSRRTTPLGGTAISLLMRGFLDRLPREAHRRSELAVS